MKGKEIRKKVINKYSLSYEELLSLKDNEIVLVNINFLYYTLLVSQLTKEKQALIQKVLDFNINKTLIEPRFGYIKGVDIKKIYQDFPKSFFRKTSFLKPITINLTPNDAYYLLIHGTIQEDSDFNKPENKWISHSIYVGLAAKRIATKLKLDENLAEALGYIHDIGRKIDHFNHPIEGYHYMIKQGYLKEAKICLTHSFIDNDITLTAGGGPKNPERYEYIQSFLQETIPTIYDNIIQLCDLFCLESGFTTIEKRILDITKRKGIFENSLNHFEKAIELKRRIEEMMHYSLYDLFPEIKKEDLENILKDQKELREILQVKTMVKK